MTNVSYASSPISKHISREVWLHVVSDPLNRNEPEECCNRPAHLKNPYCLEIHIPADDYFYSLFGLRCQDFVRGFPAVRPGCRLGKEPSEISFVKFIISITVLICTFLLLNITIHQIWFKIVLFEFYMLLSYTVLKSLLKFRQVTIILCCMYCAFYHEFKLKPTNAQG